MRLPPGEYELEVSHPGYQTRRSWITLGTTDRVEWVQLSPLPRLSETLGLRFVEIPGGSFMMGSNDGDADEQPVHPVSIAPFQLMTTEVTKGQFAKFVAATGYRTDAEKNAGGKDGCYVESSPGKGDWGYQKGKYWNNVVYSERDNQPVVCISHNDATAFIEWLNRDSAERYRLPTEAEWEYAARAGSTGKYSFGDSESALCSHANGADLSAKRQYSGWTTSDCTDDHVYTAPVGSFQANAFGLYDMHGNVWEWTQDCWKEDYKNAPSNGRAITDGDCARRVLRGGSWLGKPIGLRSAYRNGDGTDDRDGRFGLRLARDL
jgi:formylglycine-generating enzyme required for sulfatase activity